MNTISCKLKLRTDAINKHGEAPLSLQAFVNRSKIVIALGVMLPVKSWDSNSNRIIYIPDNKLSKKQVQQHNDMLVRYVDRVNDIRHHYEMLNMQVTNEQFKRDFIEDGRKYGLIQFIEKELPDLIAVRAAGSIKNLKTTIGKLKSFTPDIRFGDIDDKYITRFEGYLKRTGLSLGTVWKHHKDLKMLLNLAEKRGYKIKNPYDHYKIKCVSGIREFLVLEEIQLLEQLYLSGKLRSEHKRVLQYFLFACFTGLRISDIKKISIDDIIDGQLVFIPQKTSNIGKIQRIPLTEKAKRYITISEGKIFNTFADQVTNRYLKEIAIEAGIKKAISFHISRHSFAMLFLKSGGTPQTLQIVLGHRKSETTAVYTHITNDDIREKMLLMDMQ